MIRLSKNDFHILYTALLAVLEDDSDAWLALSEDDHDRAAEIMGELEYDEDDDLDEDEEDEDE